MKSGLPCCRRSIKDFMDLCTKKMKFVNNKTICTHIFMIPLYFGGMEW